MKRAWLVLLFLAGCGSMVADYKPNDPKKGAEVYSITSLYGGGLRSRELAIEYLDTTAKNMCNSGYTFIDEETRAIMNRVGEVRVSRLTWKIKCDSEAQALPP